MAATIITLEDLQQFKRELLAEIKTLLEEHPPLTTQRWLKTHQVLRLLSLSPGTLQNLRIRGKLPFTKIGGVIYYDSRDIENLLQQYKQHPQQSEQKP